MSPDDFDPDKHLSLNAARKKPIKKDKLTKNYKAFKLVWTRIEPLLPVKNVLILPGDCILPLNNISMFSLIQQLYTKNSSIRDSQHLQLVLTRKIKPFRSFQQLFPLIKNISSQYVPLLKELISHDYLKYIEGKKIQRKLVANESTNNVVSKSAKDFDIALDNYLQNLEEKYYRYQVRSSNEDKQMQMKKVGISKHLIKLLQPQSTDILVRPTPKFFKDIDNYFKYMYYNLLSLIQGGEMAWVDISLQTQDEIIIQTRFRNVYFTTPYSTKLVTITLFQIQRQVIGKVEEMRKDMGEGENVLGIVNKEAEEFFSRFYQDKREGKRERCLFEQIRRE